MVSDSRNTGVVAVDLFCGAGGLTHGLQKAGIRVKAGFDFAEDCRYAYSHNNHAKYVLQDVRDISGNDVKRFLHTDGCGKPMTLLAGCAPCQTFSTYNRKADCSDPRWNLLNELLRLIKETKPDLVAMENVPGLASKEVFQEFVKELRRAGYENLSCKIVRCEDYGLPQHRRRLVFMASLLGPIEILSPEQFGSTPRTVRDAIGLLPKVAAGSADENDRLHRTFSLSELNLKRIQASRPGGTWADWPEEIRFACHRKASGATYKSVCGRMQWDQPSPTMTTQFINYGTGRFGHPEQDRALTLREGALLQSFPADYEFVAPGEELKISNVARMIGNAVPPIIGELIGESFLAHLKSVQRGK